MGSAEVGPEFRAGSHVAEIVKTEIRHDRFPIVLAWFRLENSTAVVRIRIALTPNNVIAKNKLRALLVHGRAVSSNPDTVDEDILASMFGNRLRVIVKFWLAPDGARIPVVDFVRSIEDDR